MTKNIIKTNQMFPVRLVFLIDIFITGISFVLSYYLCSFILPDIRSHGMLIQLPIIVALTSMIFLFIGIYKGYVKYDKVREVYNIFNAICITNILTIILLVVNGKLFMENNLMVPISIIVVHSILSFTGLVASRSLFKYFTGSQINLINKKEESIFICDNTLKSEEVDAIVSLLEKDSMRSVMVLKQDNGALSFENSFSSLISDVDKVYLHIGVKKDESQYVLLLNKISDFKKSTYLLDLIGDKNSPNGNELDLTLISGEKNEEEKTIKSEPNKKEQQLFEGSMTANGRQIIEHQTT